MSILVDKDTRLVVQGITGREGLFHSKEMIEYGTQVVAGTRPGKGGEWVLGGKVPVFDSVQIAVDATEANTSVIFVPARFAPDAMLEAADAGIALIVCLTELIPIQDVMRVRQYLENKKVRLIGPNCPGLLTPNKAKVGIIPGNIAIPGNIGVVSRSGTLTYEILFALKEKDLSTYTEKDADNAYFAGMLQGDKDVDGFAIYSIEHKEVDGIKEVNSTSAASTSLVYVKIDPDLR